MLVCSIASASNSGLQEVLQEELAHVSSHGVVGIAFYLAWLLCTCHRGGRTKDDGCQLFVRKGKYLDNATADDLSMFDNVTKPSMPWTSNIVCDVNGEWELLR